MKNRNWYGEGCCIPHGVWDAYAALSRAKGALERSSASLPMPTLVSPLYEHVSVLFEVTTRLCMHAFAATEPPSDVSQELRDEVVVVTQAFADFYRPFLVLKKAVRLEDAFRHSGDVEAVAAKLLMLLAEEHPADACARWRETHG
jgi:hypothetical protein